VLLKLPKFDILFPVTVEETCLQLSKYQTDAKILAGGTDLLVKMKHRRALPRCLLNIKRIPGLAYIREDGGEGLRIGALTSFQAIKSSPAIGKRFPMLGQAARKVGTTQIRNLGTLGGNLANGSPSAESAPALLTLGASIACHGTNGERRIPIDEFFVGPGKTALRQDEVLTGVRLPEMPAGAHGVYLKQSLRRMDVSVAGAAVFVVLEGDVCLEARIALGAVGPTPFRARKAEALLRGERIGERVETELLDAVARTASGESLPIDDIRGYANYRKQVIESLVRQGVERAVAGARS
jgi:carbon-monoxide dehydrogenase medium subunit